MALRVWLPFTQNMQNQGLSNAIIQNVGAVRSTRKKIGTSCYFDGSDDYVSINSSELRNCFKGGSHPFSIAMWIYNAKETGNRAVLFGDYGLSGAIGFNIELNSSVNYNDDVRFYWNASPDYRATNTNITPNTWVHLTIVYNGTKVDFYRNGILIDSLTGTLDEKNKISGNFYLGRDSRTGTTAFKGYLDDVRIYDEALSKKQVQEISKGLILHYKLDNYIDNFISNNIEQCTIMPEADATTVNRIIQYIGTTDSTYTNGNFYQGIVTNIWDAGSESYIPTYSWSSADPQFSNFITDVSGNGYTGTIGGTLIFNNDSPRYNKSTQFNGSSWVNSAIGNVLCESKDFTISGWFYHVSGTNYYNGGNSGAAPVCLDTTRFFIHSSDATFYAGTWTPTSNVWQYITLVHNSIAQTLTLYINGVQNQQITTDGTVYFVQDFNLGGRQGGSQFNGSISDFRIYATALSINDIKELYQTSTLIDNQHNAYAFAFVEEE